MWYRIFVVLVACLLLVPGMPSQQTSLSEPVNQKLDNMIYGYGLLDICTMQDHLTPKDTSEWREVVGDLGLLCTGYILGVRDGLLVTGAINPRGPFFNGQTEMIVVRYLQNHPDQLEKQSPLLVRDALVEAWPPVKRASKDSFVADSK